MTRVHDNAIVLPVSAICVGVMHPSRLTFTSAGCRVGLAIWGSSTRISLSSWYDVADRVMVELDTVYLYECWID